MTSPIDNVYHRLLHETRQNAVAENQYNSSNIRKCMSDEVIARCSGKKPYDWQLDLAEALLSESTL